jgi:predicted peroxiredoxin
VADERLIFNCTHGADAPERATIPFIAANVAAVSGQQATVVCTIDAVWIGTPGYAGKIHEEGMPPLAELLQPYLDAGGELWLCSACTTTRGITGDDLIPGAEIVGAAQIVEALTRGRAISLG